MWNAEECSINEVCWILDEVFRSNHELVHALRVWIFKNVHDILRFQCDLGTMVQQ
jgi:hypothetical protein